MPYGEQGRTGEALAAAAAQGRPQGW